VFWVRAGVLVRLGMVNSGLLKRVGIMFLKLGWKNFQVVNKTLYLLGINGGPEGARSNFTARIGFEIGMSSNPPCCIPKRVQV